MDKAARRNPDVRTDELTKPESDTGETRIGIALYWLIIYVFAIGFGGLAEALADGMTKLVLGFGGRELTASLGDIPLLVFVAIVFSGALTWVLLFGEKLISAPLGKTAHWFKAFSLAFVFLGSHIFYAVIQVTHSVHP